MLRDGLHAGLLTIAEVGHPTERLQVQIDVHGNELHVISTCDSRYRIKSTDPASLPGFDSAKKLSDSLAFIKLVQQHGGPIAGQAKQFLEGLNG